ncbi:type II toxin-antitoxin system VapB family antitoxin [Sphingobium sp. AS12]|uniref:type II toxin-antitoxin system VapB family antitoxin n=1 Tax=Sphingobium sp. AS12 TaxID=2849495 RepID=UPI001C313373|nr:type II toxin-antitoxin system VapB family antitoxin [Sphingobium sp. AS12]MBV2149877.1 type II toxin-antitoxin system VapB family antitoxin [Sphingobium sp. AS12]
MSRAEHIQFNVRSAFARARAHELAKLTGMTATQVVEDALRGYVPPGAVAKVGRLVQRGPILVRPAGGARVSLEEANAALEAARERDA